MLNMLKMRGCECFIQMYNHVSVDTSRLEEGAVTVPWDTLH